MDWDLKKMYNENLTRWHKAEANENKIKLNHIPELKKLTEKLSAILYFIGDYTEAEAMQGFKIN
jgi:hypothetical protein